MSPSFLRRRAWHLIFSTTSSSIATDISHLHLTTQPAESNETPEKSITGLEKAAEAPNQPQETKYGTKRPQRPVPAGLLRDFILENLSFKSMTDREDEVAEAHSNTFDWILKAGDPTKGSQGAAFTKWLQTDEMGNIYWSK